MCGEQVKAVILNSGRFELTEDRALADAVLVLLGHKMCWPSQRQHADVS